MKKTIVAVIAVLGVVVAAGGGYWLGQQRSDVPGAPGKASQAGAGGAEKGPGGPAPAIIVEAITATTAPMPQTITAVGSLRSDESVTLRPEVAGRVIAIGFQEGRPVVKGATLVKLDPAVNEAEAQQAKANLTLAKAKMERAIDLQKQGFISGQARDEAENNLRLAEAATALAAARLAKTEIRAPFSGVIGLRSVSVGDYVKEGQDMVNLEQIDPLKVDFRVPEIYLSQVQAGQALQISLEAMPGQVFEGRIFAINPLLDAAGRSIVIRAQLRNDASKLRPGQFARVRLFTKENAEAMTVPEQAVVPSGDEFFIVRVVDGKAQRVKVELGQRREGLVEVVRGLAATDTVITAGQFKVREGVSVRAAAQPPEAPKAAGTVAPKSDKPGGAS